jgi:hypothetical protein
MVFSGGGARAHPSGVAPEASVELFGLLRGLLCVLLNCSVIRVFLFEVWSIATEPPSLVRTGSIRVSTVFYRSTLMLPF